MRFRLALACAATLALAACSESSTAPTQLTPGARNNDLTCKSGYHIATRANGTQYCEPDPESPQRAAP
jgi:hypothetical protein